MCALSKNEIMFTNPRRHIWTTKFSNLIFHKTKSNEMNFLTK